MVKTSVYLDEAEAAALKRTAALTGRPMAELIREGIHHVVTQAGHQPRTFRSMGKGEGDGRPITGWDADELHDWVMGKR